MTYGSGFVAPAHVGLRLGETPSVFSCDDGDDDDDGDDGDDDGDDDNKLRFRIFRSMATPE